MKNKVTVLGLLVAALIFTCACGMVSSLLGGKSAGTVNDLWPDVPKMDGITKTEMDMPLAARLALKAISQGKVNFIAYTTDAQPQAVLDFYTADRMKSQGWAAQDSSGNGSPCFGDTSSSDSGSICVFTKNANGKNEILAIVAATDSDTKKTDIFFARIDASDETTATPTN
jgi:hypothetical protein